jgi:hypothetical protein
LSKISIMRAAAVAAVTLWGADQAFAQAKTRITVEYPLGFIFDKVLVELNAEFEKQSHLFGTIYLPAFKEHEDTAQSTLDQAIAKRLLGAALEAINLQRVVAGRSIAVVLRSFIAKVKDWKGQGVSDPMMALDRYSGRPYGLAFAVSIDEIFALSKGISELGNDTIRLFYSWTIAGNWMWQALGFSYGDQMTGYDERKVPFDPELDNKAITLIGPMMREGGMSDVTLEASRLSSPSSPVPPGLDSRAALYVIETHTVYMPNGDRLEAHSGLGNRFDDPRYVHERNRGATPPHVYDLELRRGLFHGVAALRLKPIGDGNMFGRAGMLAHSYMLGPRGDSHGCVVFRDYSRFLEAFRSGEVSRLVVVTHLTTASSNVATMERSASNYSLGSIELKESPRSISR